MRIMKASEQCRRTTHDGIDEVLVRVLPLQIIPFNEPCIVRHRQLNVIQEDEVRKVDLEPVVPGVAGLQHGFEHLEDLLDFRLQDLVDDYEINLEVDDGWYWDLGVVGAGGVGVVGEAKTISADDGPGLFDEAAAYPELEGSFDEGKVLGLLLAAIDLLSRRRKNLPCFPEQSETSSV
jgi:hypothetical protein